MPTIDQMKKGLMLKFFRLLMCPQKYLARGRCRDGLAEDSPKGGVVTNAAIN